MKANRTELLVRDPANNKGENSPNSFRVFGLIGSMGAFEGLRQILAGLPGDFPGAVIILRHRTTALPNYSVDLLQRRCRLPVKEAEDEDSLLPGIVYVAKPGFHLLVTAHETLQLSLGPKIRFVRPSGDCLLDSMARNLKSRAIAVILSGYDADGSGALNAIRRNDGVVIVQSPDTAECSTMPSSAIATHQVDYVVPLDQISAFMYTLANVAPESIHELHRQDGLRQSAHPPS